MHNVLHGLALLSIIKAATRGYFLHRPGGAGLRYLVDVAFSLPRLSPATANKSE